MVATVFHIAAFVLTALPLAAGQNQCRWTCPKDNCKGTWSNPLPRGEQWYEWSIWDNKDKAAANTKVMAMMSGNQFQPHKGEYYTTADTFRNALSWYPTIAQIAIAGKFKTGGGCCAWSRQDCALCCNYDTPPPTSYPTEYQCSEEYGCGEDRSVIVRIGDVVRKNRLLGVVAVSIAAAALAALALCVYIRKRSSSEAGHYAEAGSDSENEDGSA